MVWVSILFSFFFFNDTATTEIYTLSLHDALPISYRRRRRRRVLAPAGAGWDPRLQSRSEEHTSELQSPCNLVCRLLLEKKKKKSSISTYTILMKKIITPPRYVLCISELQELLYPA